jgi:hypothetical protein
MLVATARIESDLFWIISLFCLALRVWALGDCLVRKTASFPAAGKLTKPAWALLNALSVVIGLLIRHNPINFLPLAFLVVTLVYLTDVRPAVREVSGGSRW